MSSFICRNISCPKKLELMYSQDDKAILEISDDKSRYTMTVYQVFPGIQLVYSDAHVQSVTLKEREKASDNIFEISHCREGRLEYEVNGEYHHLSPGDVAITKSNWVSQDSYFPLGHYHGISIRIDLEQTPECMSCILEDVKVNPKDIAIKFFSKEGSFVERENPVMENIFSQLYSVRSDIKKGYFKLKILELLMYLSTVEVKQKQTEKRISKSQAILAKNISDYLIQHINDRITLGELSDKFHVSETHIKNTFKEVYNTTPNAFIRNQKMESAAYMLEYTDKSILEIAGEHGYDNGSKFAGAFKNIKGMTPNQYRNANYKKKKAMFSCAEYPKDVSV